MTTTEEREQRKTANAQLDGMTEGLRRDCEWIIRHGDDGDMKALSDLIDAALKAAEKDSDDRLGPETLTTSENC